MTDFVEPLEEDAEDRFNEAPCGYVSTRLDGVIVRVNDTFCRLSDRRREEIVGKLRLPELMAIGDQIYFETHVAPLLSTQGAVKEIAAEIVRPDRSRVAVLLNAASRPDSEGRPVGARWTVFDATDRRAYERELLVAQRRAERSESQLRTLLELTAGLAALELFDDITSETMRAISQVFGASDGNLWLWSDRTGLLHRRVVPGLSAAFQAALPSTIDPFGFGPHVDVLRTRQPVVLTADEASKRFPQLVRVMALGGHRTVVYVPLVDLADDVGVLAVGFESDVTFEPDRLALLQSMAQQAARALHRAKSLETARRAAQQDSFILEVTRAMNAARSVHARIDELVRALVGRVARRVEVVARTDDVPNRTAQDHAMIASHSDLQSASHGQHVVLTLRNSDEILAELHLDDLSGSRGFPAGDVAFFDRLADSVALSLQNARLFERERSIALTLQRSQLVSHAFDDPRVEVAYRYFAADQSLEIGGDWYDAFGIGDGNTIALSVGDIVGGGLDAATAMGQIRSATRALAGAGFSPAEILDQLDRFVQLIPQARYATMVFVELDLRDGGVRMASAGHPPALLVRAGDEPDYLWSGRSVPLGVPDTGSPPRSDAVLRIDPGDQLLLYTDGLIERRNEPLDVGLARLAGCASQSAVSVNSFINDLCATLTGEGASSDDVCVLVARYRGFRA